MIFRYYPIIVFLILFCEASLAQSKLESMYRKGIEINAYTDSTKTKAIFQLKPTFRFQSRFETSGDAAGNEKWESNFLIR
ncbi:MAG: hypothetical protein KBF73_10625, partial [Flavobacteriales bacterium]|nr:hypothetical protein [Flavobacteriales bacterium]